MAKSMFSADFANKLELLIINIIMMTKLLFFKRVISKSQMPISV